MQNLTRQSNTFLQRGLHFLKSLFVHERSFPEPSKLVEKKNDKQVFYKQSQLQCLFLRPKLFFGHFGDLFPCLQVILAVYLPTGSAVVLAHGELLGPEGFHLLGKFLVQLWPQSHFGEDFSHGARTCIWPTWPTWR